MGRKQSSGCSCRIKSTLVREFLAEFLGGSQDDNICHLLFYNSRYVRVSCLWNSLNSPVCIVAENKGKLLHHQLGVKLVLTSKEKKW